MEEGIVRVLPKDLEAEQSVIGSLILANDKIPEIASIIVPDDFYHNDLRLVYEAILELSNNDKAVDIVTLKSHLENKGNLDKVGGMSVLSKLAVSVPTSINAKFYADIVRDKSTLRKIIKVNEEISRDAYSSEDAVENILASAEEKIFKLALKRDSKDFSGVRDLVTPLINKLEERAKSKSRITGIATGFHDIDRLMSGLQDSDLILIAARPSMGKTAFALNILAHIGIKEKKTCAMFSLEMSKEQLLTRMICSESSIDSQKLRTGRLAGNDWEKLASGAILLTGAEIYIDDTPSIMLSELRSKCRKLKVEKGLDLVVIDYLQLMSGSGKKSSREQEISEISRGLKALAREIEAPVVALSQLSRATESRKDNRPILSDLRESGAIEQDADVVMFLYRDEYYNKDTEHKNEAEVIIAKQRNGPTQTVHLVWSSEFTKFRNMLK